MLVKFLEYEEEEDDTTVVTWTIIYNSAVYCCHSLTAVTDSAQLSLEARLRFVGTSQPLTSSLWVCEHFKHSFGTAFNVV